VADELELSQVQARVIAIDEVVQASNAVATTEDDAKLFSNFGAIVPPLDPRSLSQHFLDSAALRPNIDAYAVNIDGFGYRLEPTIDLARLDGADPENAPADLREAVRTAMLAERIADGDEDDIIEDAEVTAFLRALPVMARRERLRCEQFFTTCCSDGFQELRERTRHDVEVTGNGFWEVLRTAEGQLAEFVYIPSISMRLIAQDIAPCDFEEKRRVSATGYRRFKTRRRFRRFVQVLHGQFVAYFKEFGDPRAVSAATGNPYPNEAAMRKAEPSARLATEIIHWKVHSPMTAYGVPRWVGATLAVLGSRAAEEVNYTYFDNKAVPPMAILVSGGKLANGAAESIKQYIRDNIKGRDNFHKILVVEAEGASGAPINGGAGSRVRIELKSLMDAQQQDALFQVYDANNVDKVGNQFRLPRILRGDTKDFNRATADAALEYAEQQVFQPERNRFDEVMNRRVLPLLGVRFYKFVSNSHASKDPAQIVEMATKAANEGGLTINELRKLLSDAFSTQLDPIDEAWAAKPLRLVIAELQSAGGAPAPEPDAKRLSLAEEADRLIRVRAAIEETAALAEHVALSRARREEGEHVETITVPPEVMAKWLEPAPE
jgi:PBSX family phage portal protein